MDKIKKKKKKKVVLSKTEENNVQNNIVYLMKYAYIMYFSNMPKHSRTFIDT